jgi:hypothetical protein
MIRSPIVTVRRPRDSRRREHVDGRRLLAANPVVDRLEEWLAPNLWAAGAAMLAYQPADLAIAAAAADRPIERPSVERSRADQAAPQFVAKVAATAKGEPAATSLKLVALSTPSFTTGFDGAASTLIKTPAFSQPATAAGGAIPGLQPAPAPQPRSAAPPALDPSFGEPTSGSIMFASGANATGPSPNITMSPSPAPASTLPATTPATVATTPAPATSLASSVLGPVLSHVPLTFEALAAPSKGYEFIGLNDTAIAAPNGVELGLPSVNGESTGVATPRLDVQFVGANSQATGEGLNSLYAPGAANPSFEWVRYAGVYAGVGLDYHAQDSHLEYDFVVSPGADPATIALGFGGVSTDLSDSGDLILHESAGDVVQPLPMVYQEVAGGRQQVDASYVLRADHSVGFQLGTYDPTQALVIDPGAGPQSPDPTNPLGPFAVSGEGGGAKGTAVIDGTGKVTGVTLNAGGAGYKFAPSVTLVGGGGTGATAVPTLDGKPVTALTLTSGGSGYAIAPTVLITGAGTGATATATLTGDRVTGITLTGGGAGYTSPTLVTFLGERTASATATVVAGKVTALTITDRGLGYSTAPIVVITDGAGGSGARATATVAGGRVTGLTLTAMGAGYDPATTRVVLFGGEASQATATATVAAGAVTGLTITGGGLRYSSAPSVVILGAGAGATATATIDATGAVNSLMVTAGGAGYVAATTSVVILGDHNPETPATATATVAIGAGGPLTGFTITTGDSGVVGGTGYTSAPAVVIADNPETYHFDTAFKTDLPGLNELDGAVRRPTDLTKGPYAVVMFLHGNHDPSVPSYLGYDYIAKTLATFGYFVDSISANGINGQNQGAEGGMLARAELIEEHLDILNAVNTGGTKVPATAGVPTATRSITVPDPLLSSGIANARLRGTINLNNVGVMGHSRGGEAVVKLLSYNAGQEAPKPERQYGIRAVFSLAPTDFNRSTVRDVPGLAIPQATLLPYLDGDVSDLQGVHYFDDISPGGSKYDTTGGAKDNAPRHAILVQEANHNYFNTVWTPGNGFPASDDFPSKTPFPATDTVHKKLTPDQEKAVGNAYVTGFFRVYLGGESQFLPMFTGDASPPASVTQNIFVSYMPPASQRTDINRLDDADFDQVTPLDTNELGGAVSEVGLSRYEMFGGQNEQSSDDVYSAALKVPTDQLPHNSGAAPGLSQLLIEWDMMGTSYTNALAPAGGSLDASAAKNLDFRAAVNFDSKLNVVGDPQDFTVVLTDKAGKSDSVVVSTVSDALFYPPGSVATLVPKNVLNDVRIPLSAFGNGIDLTKLVSVTFDFDQTGEGSILLSNIRFDDKATAVTISPSVVSIVRKGFAKVVGSVPARFLQQVTLTNPSDTDIAGPVALVLDGLSPTVTLAAFRVDSGPRIVVGAGDITQATVPIGSPFAQFVPAGGTFFGGSSITLTLEFTTTTPSLGITYATRILAGPGAR